MKATTQTQTQQKRRLEDDELLDLVASISRSDGTRAADFINEAVQEATAKALGYTYGEYVLFIRQTPSERLETVHLVAQRNSVPVADFIREAVIAAAARSIGMERKNLEDILAKTETWATIYC